jgi:hypothetical protein
MDPTAAKYIGAGIACIGMGRGVASAPSSAYLAAALRTRRPRRASSAISSSASR